MAYSIYNDSYVVTNDDDDKGKRNIKTVCEAYNSKFDVNII